MARARLTNSGEVIRPTEQTESTEAETQVTREFEGGSGLQIDERGVMIGDTEIPMSFVLVALIVLDISITAGFIFDD